MKTTIITFGALVLTACAATPPPVQPSEMSAAQHESEAKKELQAAKVHSAEYDAKASVRIERCASGAAAHEGAACWTSITNPTEHHVDEAKAHEQHAAAHRAASQALRDAEARVCADIDPIDRDVSPFAHREDVIRVAAVPHGALVVFRGVPGLTADGLQKIIDCHIARNAAVGHDMPEMTYCPLVPKDVTARAEVTRQGLFEVTIRSDNDESAREILRRAQMLVKTDK